MASGVFDEMLSSIGAAVADVREKVVEEGYFGRVVTDNQPAAQEQKQAELSPFDAALEKLNTPAVPEQSRDTPEPGGGMER